MVAESVVSDFRSRLLNDIDYETPRVINVLHSWALSHVERLIFGNAQSVIFKCSVAPLLSEGDVLIRAEKLKMPVPHVYACLADRSAIGMILQDLGSSLAPALDQDGMTAAIAVHSSGLMAELRLCDADEMARWPERMLANVHELVREGRWTAAGDLTGKISALRAVAPDLLAGAELPPFGLCHSELHPNSVIVTAEMTAHSLTRPCSRPR
jgi:hypothetical protein